MSPSFCPNCGAPATPGATFCAACGSPLRAPGASPATPLGPAAPAPVYGTSAVQPPANRDADRRAISNVTIAAAVSLLSAAVSVASLFLRSDTSLGVTITEGSHTTITFPLSSLYLLAATGGLGVAFGLVELWFYRSAFRELKPVDPRFSTPSTLTLLAFVSVLAIALIGAGFLVLLYEAIQCAGSDTFTSACFSVSAAAGLLLLLVIFAIIAVVGWIGMLIGIWRLGGRYNETLFKVGAVLLIVPLLNIVGIILILVAARDTRAKLEGPPPAMPTFGGS